MNLAAIAGSGPEGRIIKRDVEAAMGGAAQVAVQPVAEGSSRITSSAGRTFCASCRARWFVRSSPHLADAQDHCASLGGE